MKKKLLIIIFLAIILNFKNFYSSGDSNNINSNQVLSNQSKRIKKGFIVQKLGKTYNDSFPINLKKFESLLQIYTKKGYKNLYDFLTDNEDIEKLYKTKMKRFLQKNNIDDIYKLFVEKIKTEKIKYFKISYFKEFKNFFKKIMKEEIDNKKIIIQESTILKINNNKENNQLNSNISQEEHLKEENSFENTQSGEEDQKNIEISKNNIKTLGKELSEEYDKKEYKNLYEFVKNNKDIEIFYKKKIKKFIAKSAMENSEIWALFLSKLKRRYYIFSESNNITGFKKFFQTIMKDEIDKKQIIIKASTIPRKNKKINKLKLNNINMKEKESFENIQSNKIFEEDQNQNNIEIKKNRKKFFAKLLKEYKDKEYENLYYFLIKNKEIERFYKEKIKKFIYKNYITKNEEELWSLFLENLKTGNFQFSISSHMIGIKKFFKNIMKNEIDKKQIIINVSTIPRINKNKENNQLNLNNISMEDELNNLDKEQEDNFENEDKKYIESYYLSSIDNFIYYYLNTYKLENKEDIKTNIRRINYYMNNISKKQFEYKKLSSIKIEEEINYEDFTDRKDFLAKIKLEKKYIEKIIEYYEFLEINYNNDVFYIDGLKNLNNNEEKEAMINTFAEKLYIKMNLAFENNDSEDLESELKSEEYLDEQYSEDSNIEKDLIAINNAMKL